LGAGRTLLNKTARRSEQFVSISVADLFVGRRSAGRPGLDGFQIREIGRNGTFEVGFEPKIRKFFSARRDQIVEELADIGLDTASAPALAAAAALKTRRNKDGDLDNERFSLWQSKAAELGLGVGHCVDRLRSQENARSLGNEHDFAQALALIPERLTEFEATFARKDLIRAVANAHVGTSVDPAGLLHSVDQLIKTSAVVEIRRDPLNEPVYSTPEMIRLERETLELAPALADRRWHGPDTAALQRKIVAEGLSPEQANVALTLAGGSALALGKDTRTVVTALIKQAKKLPKEAV
jgi:hypothetical protein